MSSSFAGCGSKSSGKLVAIVSGTQKTQKKQQKLPRKTCSFKPSWGSRSHHLRKHFIKKTHNFRSYGRKTMLQNGCGIGIVCMDIADSIPFPWYFQLLRFHWITRQQKLFRPWLISASPKKKVDRVGQVVSSADHGWDSFNDRIRILNSRSQSFLEKKSLKFPQKNN